MEAFGSVTQKPGSTFTSAGVSLTCIPRLIRDCSTKGLVILELVSPIVCVVVLLKLLGQVADTLLEGQDLPQAVTPALSVFMSNDRRPFEF